MVTEYLAEAGSSPLPHAQAALSDRFGYGCTTCIGNSGPLPQPIADAIEGRNLVVASVLSGNRNFEGRINPDVRANYLMSPPLVVAFALAGRIDIDLDKEPLGEGRDGQPVFLRDIWPTSGEIADAVGKAVKPEMFEKSYAVVFEGDERWQWLGGPARRHVRLGGRLDLHQAPAVLRGDGGQAGARRRSARRARAGHPRRHA